MEKHDDLKILKLVLLRMAILISIVLVLFWIF